MHEYKHTHVLKCTSHYTHPGNETHTRARTWTANGRPCPCPHFHTHAHVHEIVNKKSTNTIYLFVKMNKMIVFVTSDIKIEQKHIFQSSGFAQQRHHHWTS